jgi:CRP-like cAMP-binding protein
MKLSSVPFFQNCDEEVLKIFSEDLEQCSFKRGQSIHFEDDTCTSLEIIVSGSVSIAHSSEHGDLYTVKVLDENSFIGPNNLYASDNNYFVYIEALTDTSIIKISKKAVDNALKNLNFRYQFLKLLSDTGKFMGNRLIEERKLNLHEKIKIYLKHQSIKQNNNLIVLPISKTLLASNFGVARTSLSRELQKMEQEGLITFKNRNIQIIENMI